SDGAIQDKHDLVIYDIDGIQYYLTEFQTAMQARATDEEAALIDELITMIEQAIGMRDQRKHDAAMQAGQNRVDRSKAAAARSDIQPKLLGGIADYQMYQAGEIRWRNVTVEENIDRRNYRDAENIDFRDGDLESSIYYAVPDFEGNPMYDWGKTTLVNDRSRVYKGASWADRIYWANPGTRRHLDERQSTATIGFRCAMTRVGSPRGMNDDKRRDKLKR